MESQPDDEDKRDRLPGESVAVEFVRLGMPDCVIDETLRDLIGLSEMEAAAVIDRVPRRARGIE